MTSSMLIDEEGRLAVLNRHGIPAKTYGEALDRIVHIATAATSAPIASVSAIGRDHQMLLAAHGIDPAPIPRDQSICAHALGGIRLLAIEDATADDRFAGLDLVRGPTGVRAYLGVPMVSADGYVMGTVAIMDTRPRRFTDQEKSILFDLARLAAGHLESRVSGSPDFLTGALTRRDFQSEVEREFERSSRYGCPAALIFIDIDGFAEVNRSAGMDVADEVLKAVANRCVETMRSTDIFGRIGGEEFGLLLPETMGYEASQCAERARETIANLRFRTADGVLSVTASLGIACFVPALQSAVQWFAQADIALYMAKKSGRNCVTFAPSPEDRADDAKDEIAPGTTRTINIH